MQISFLKPTEINSNSENLHVKVPSGQLLKWIGNKQRFASEIISFFPTKFNTYIEPFLGSGAVLATLASKNSIGSDCFKPLVDIFITLQSDPELLIKWYSDRWELIHNGNKKEEYERIKASYNTNPNAADLVFISRSCYGGVVRFRKIDGYISTPVGIHEPITPISFSRRVKEWHDRTRGTIFRHMEYEEAMNLAHPGDLIYCDPPYSFSQAILYGAQNFSLRELFQVISNCKNKGVYVALSIDGTKRSGDTLCDLPIPDGLFEREVFIQVGRSMLKRFQMNGKSLEGEHVSDRLLLNY
jgi:DNA adenine methylase